MAYIVIDFEFNQAFDFEDGSSKLDLGCRFEIIQIGAVKLDSDLNIIDEFNVLVKPQIYRRIHPYVERITGLEKSSFENAKKFSQAYKEFYNFTEDEKSDKIFCVWGNSDIKILYKNLKYYNIIDKPIIIKYIDVQSLATKYLKYDKGETIGLKNAVEALGIQTEEYFHNAFYDALYTAQIFKKVKSENLTIKIFNSAHIK